MADKFGEEFWTHEDLVRFIGEDGDKLRVVEDIISIRTQEATLKLAARLNPTSLPDEEALKLANKLWSNDTKPGELKKILVYLAFRSNVQAFRILEKYRENPHPATAEMARFCYQISKIILEGQLRDKPLGLLSTGLGGKNKKLRYFFVIFPAGDTPFTKNQLKIIDTEWKATCSKYELETEKRSKSTEYLAFTVLSPYQHEFIRIVEEFVEECNIYGNFILPKMVITNVKIMKKREILAAMKQIREDKDNEPAIE